MSEDQLERLTLTPGTVLAGKYSVERVLGEGGMGVVVAAMHLELGERVAVKFLHPDAVANEEVAARFVREARAAVKIKNEHVARIIDVGRMDNGSPYMVMEYLEGHDLSAEKHGAGLGVEDAVDFVIQACDAMAEAHAAGIVHRDLKPANLFLTQRADGAPLVKVLDFGISKVSQPDVESLSLTKTATAMGSPLYMSPEQMRSAKTVDHRADIWSLGVILYELLAKTTPFTGSSLPELCAAIFADSPRDIRQFRPDLPPELEKVVLRCLERDPALRYQNVAELAGALAPFAPRRSRPLVERIGKVLSRAGLADEPELPASVALPGASEPPKAAVTTTPFVEGARTNAAWTETSAPEPRKKSPTAAALLALAGLGVLGAAAWALTRPPAPSPEPASPSTALQPAPSVARQPEPSVEPVAAPTPAPAASAAPAPSASAPAAVKPREAKPAEKKPEPKPEPEAKPEPKPAPKPKNPLDIGLK